MTIESFESNKKDAGQLIVDDSPDCQEAEKILQEKNLFFIKTNLTETEDDDYRSTFDGRVPCLVNGHGRLYGVDIIRGYAEMVSR